MLKKYAVRFIFPSDTRTYIVTDIGTADAICQCIDLIECEAPALLDSSIVSLAIKTWPAGGEFLAAEGNGPLIDTTKIARRAADCERVAA